MSKHCFHCQDELPKGFEATLKVNGETRYFCCFGCQAIAETIVTGGLESFYQHRTQAALRPDEFNNTAIDELKLYDDPELQDEFVEKNEQQRLTSLSISGITCAACIWLLEKEISKLAGVTSFNVNHSSHKATLSWQTDAINLSDILIHIRKLGYKALPYEVGLARKNAESEKKTSLFRIAVAGIASMQNMMFAMPLYLGFYSGISTEFVSFFRWVSLLMCVPVVLFSAKPFFKAAYRDLKTKQLTMDLPVSIAIAGAFLASTWITVFQAENIEADVYFDSVSMFTFFLLLGRFIEMQTRHRHLNSDIEIASLLPDTAQILVDGTERSIPSHKLAIDDILIVKQGAIIAADGFVIEGVSRVDESALTGEFLPIKKQQGSFVSGGTTNIENALLIKLTAKPKDSRVAAIIKLLDKAQSDKPRTVMLADKLASYFVAAVLLISVAVGFFWSIYAPENIFPIMLSVLVVTCPCALSLATPTALTSANTFLRSQGFLIAKSHTLEAMNQVSDIVFDKTGTLTQGKLRLEKITVFKQFNESQVLEIAAALEAESSHPIAQSFAPFLQKPANDINHEIGRGVSGIYTINGHTARFYLGNLAFNSTQTSTSLDINNTDLNLFLSDGKDLLAQFTLSDGLREDSVESIRQLKAAGLNLHILSGDQLHTVRHISETLGIDSYHAAQSPEQKLAFVQALQAEGKHIAMVGDGINDLPVLSGAKLSIAMGESADITKLNSDAILLNSHLSVLVQAFQKAKQTRKIIKENISWAIGYNLCMLPLAAAGMVPPYFAALGMSLSSLIVVFNSVRLKR